MAETADSLSGFSSAAPRPALQDVRDALYKKIIHYAGGGKEGLWKSIDPRLKALTGGNLDGIKPSGNNSGISRAAFLRAVTRLKEPIESDARERAKDEKINLKIQGNVLLLMNIFELLKINNVSDLLGHGFQETDLKEAIVSSNVKNDKILEKINLIHEDLKLSMRRTPRFSKQKICRDFEVFINEIYNFLLEEETGDASKDNAEPGKNRPSFLGGPTMDNAFWDLVLSDPEIKFVSWCKAAFENHKEYFSQNKLIYKFYEKLSTNKYRSQEYLNEVVLLCPLYILYFLLDINRRFLNAISDEAVTDKNNPTQNGEEIDNPGVQELLGGQKPRKYVYTRNLSILNNLKELLYSDYIKYLKFNEELFEKTKSILKYGASVFRELYFEHILFNPEQLLGISNSITSLNELNSIILFGRLIQFKLTGELIDKINFLAVEIEQVKSIFERNASV
jgi:hypothetical protein